jgi:tRNA(fMet)-specific endonuclease VapC
LTPKTGRYALDTSIVIALLKDDPDVTLAASMDFTACDEDVCQHYATVKARLAAAGRPIPANDLWVAACALATEATLVTRDAHFDAIESLATESW